MQPCSRALTTWLPLAGGSVLHQSCHATSRFLAEWLYLLSRMIAAFQGSFSRRHDAHLVSLIRPVTIPLSPGHKQCLAAGVSNQTLLAAKILRKGLPGLWPRSLAGVLLPEADRVSSPTRRDAASTAAPYVSPCPPDSVHGTQHPTRIGCRDDLACCFT